MDPVLQELLVGLAANGLSDLISRCADTDDVDNGSDPVADAVEAAASQLSDVESILPSLGGETLRTFLQSQEASNVVRQIFASTNQQQVAEIENEFYELWRFWMDSSAAASRQDIGRVFKALVELCQYSLDAAIASGSLTALDAQAAKRHAELRGALESLDRSVQLISSGSVTGDEIDDYAKKYRRQLAAREGTITPPALDSARQIPIDSLYVPARLSEIDADATEPVSYDHFAPTLFRRVVLGNPGSGKSTLAKKLAADIARDRIHVGTRQAGLVPFLVVLRDYGARKRDTPCSIVDFISSNSNARYQVPPPPGAIEYLLLTNRALVIFDGLDELLDTTYRAEISGDVESFAHLYPSVPILVTSREVGYSQAPLSPTVFTPFRLSPFSDNEVQQYARNWFSVADNCMPNEAESQADGFMKDSASVADLRSNALMLGLMCNLYKGSGYIPRNRPDVYEACAELLFDRWDRLRQIGKPLSIESLLRPTMQYLAAWIYADVERQSGVTEEELVSSASDFLLDRRFENIEEAELEARRFIEFCRGRAWVFTDTGTTPAGDRLYQFTHRTFLEFFTAGYLVRTNRDPKKLHDVLDPHISVGEWDVVAQLSFQLLEHSLDGAADSLLTIFLEKQDEPSEQAQQNRCDFAARSLEFLVPSPGVTRQLTSWALDALMSSRHMETPIGPNDTVAGTDPRVTTVLALLRANPENHMPIQDALVEGIAPYLKTSVAVEAAELALNLRSGQGIAAGAGQRDLARDTTYRILEEQLPLLRNVAKSDWKIGCDLVLLGALSPETYLEAFGLEAWLEERPYRLYSGMRRVPLAEIIVANLLLEYPNQLSLETALSCLTALSSYLFPQEVSNVGNHDASGSWLESISNAEEDLKGFMKRSFNPFDLSPDQLYSFLVLMAVFFENDPRQAEDVASRTGSELAYLASAMLTARSDGGDWSSSVGILDKLPSGKSELVREWVRGNISFGFRDDKPH